MTETARHDAGARLRRTPLHALHGELEAKFCPFAGYDMPISYPLGVLKEHLHLRRAAGLFDVSHMGQIALRARSGNVADAARALERVTPIDVLDLADNRQRYGFLTNHDGGILDDLMVARLGDRLILVVNAANKAADEAHLRASIADLCEIEPLDQALIAVQGPGAEIALARLAPDVAGMRFMDFREVEIVGARCSVSRSGYTGEDGFEISAPSKIAQELAQALLADDAVQPIGLGARDSLRLEAGLCLHGADIDAGTTPVEASLLWAIPPVRRLGGAREGGFPGDQKILDQIASGAPRRRVGLRPEGRVPVRAGAKLFAAEDDDEAAGAVTSGGFGPSVNAPVAMGYLPKNLARVGQRVFAEVRGQRMPAVVSPLPFVPARFKRG
ncbi:glycine cleavage system aminomethyltransferase GcvT [Chenggangzhangella methanolivorans]|uniref:aminomethyltransferase n=1 Tax=Chenggangzhangella methanolivorans TaxID=1437009 RepID=A0A9E6RC98_9HYPH|nr:glycine cleavage system aminomethyltransferase GcvT [Chenggangzhangella methanolivorans]QZO02156.1 glycine cleavage system aminomethyltransferase GcvT [Chenggangzhangella methanolivorans]